MQATQHKTLHPLLMQMTRIHIQPDTLNRSYNCFFNFLGLSTIITISLQSCHSLHCVCLTAVQQKITLQGIVTTKQLEVIKKLFHLCLGKSQNYFPRCQERHFELLPSALGFGATVQKFSLTPQEIFLTVPQTHMKQLYIGVRVFSLHMV